jgi:hypothetical protein
MCISVTVVTVHRDSYHHQFGTRTQRFQFVLFVIRAHSPVTEITAHSPPSFLHSFLSEPEVLIPGD